MNNDVTHDTLSQVRAPACPPYIPLTSQVTQYNTIEFHAVPTAHKSFTFLLSRGESPTLAGLDSTRAPPLLIRT